MSLNVGGGRSKKRKKAPSTILYTTAVNDEGRRQACIYARCEFGEIQVGPIWSHTDQSVRRALATLSEQCDCPSKYHQAVEFEGRKWGAGGSRR